MQNWTLNLTTPSVFHNLVNGHFIFLDAQAKNFGIILIPLSYLPTFIYLFI